MDRRHRDPRDHPFRGPRDPRDRHGDPRHHREFMDDDDMEEYMDFHHRRFDPRMAEERRIGKIILFLILIFFI